jgi:putative tryptophan/tyrosine transport system substrate-binding protein
MKRSAFLVVLSVALLGEPCRTFGQPVGKIYRVGILGIRGKFWESFRQGLRDLGYLEGRNLVLEQRYSEEGEERFLSLAVELLALKVDVLVTSSTPATVAAKRATRTTPIVMATVLDPVGAGLVASLARPGGNITGLSEASDELSSKRLQLLKEAIPTASRLVVLFDPTHPLQELELRRTQTAAGAFGVTLHPIAARRPSELESAFSMITERRAQALIVIPGNLSFIHRADIVELAIRNRLPAMYGWRDGAEVGALLSYGINFDHQFRRAAAYVDEILKGAKPADLPIEQPTTFELVINLKTAKALGLTIPQSLLLRADQVIE